MNGITKNELNFVIRELQHTYPELKPVIHGNDKLIKFLYIEKIMGIPAETLMNMTLGQIIEFGRSHMNENIRMQFM